MPAQISHRRSRLGAASSPSIADWARSAAGSDIGSLPSDSGRWSQEEDSISSSTALSIGARVRMPARIEETDIAMMAEHNQICERFSSRVSDTMG
jgi:hypothetical protein